jgi:tetratricopeptide (TPR) repeat protein
MSSLTAYTLEIAPRDETRAPWYLPVESRRYLLRLDTDQSYSHGEFSWAPELLDDLRSLAQPDPDPGVAMRVGKALRTFLEQMTGWTRVEDAIERELRAEGQVHLVFRLAATELYSLPWELLPLKTTARALGELPRCHICYEWPGAAATTRAAPTGDGRILLGWSTAGGSVPADQHAEALGAASADVGDFFLRSRDILPGLSRRALAEELANPHKPTVTALHLLCHGSTATSGVPGLLWNSHRPSAATEFVDEGALRRLLEPHLQTLRLVVLSACRSGDASGPGALLGGLGQALHRLGIPAVVCSRFPLSSEGSIEFTRALYAGLLDRAEPIQLALANARERLQLTRGALDWATLQLYAHTEGSPEIRPLVLRPYRGLLAFEPQHHRFFQGREELVSQLVHRMEEARAGRAPSFQLVVGASGSGKTSLVQAGLAATLARKDWEILSMHPAPNLAEEVRRRREGHPRRSLLVVIDPLEEIFTTFSAAEQQPWVRQLQSLCRAEAPDVIVLAVLRLDALERCADILLDDAGTTLVNLAFDEMRALTVLPLSPERLRQVIERPAQRVGLKLEEGLTERILHDAAQEPGLLPLLAHVLDLLWQHREGPRLTLRAYEALGGLAGALMGELDRLVDRSMSEDESRQARRLLLALIDFRDEAAPFTRRRVHLEQVRPKERGAREAFDAALEALTAHRVIVRGGDSASAHRAPWLEIAHESLLRRWKRLGEWVSEDREWLARQRRLESLAEEWFTHRGAPDRGAAFLLSGSRLDLVRSLQEEWDGRREPLPSRLIEFIEASEQADLERTRQLCEEREVTHQLLHEVEQGLAAVAGSAHARRQLLELVARLQAASRTGMSEGVDQMLDRWRVHQRRGDLARTHEGLARARQEYEAALALARELAGHTEEIRVQAVLATSYEKLGVVAEDEGRLTEAREAYVQALDLRQRLAAQHPQDVHLARALAWSHHTLGQLAFREADLPRARVALTKAIAGRRALIDGGHATRPLRRELSFSLNKMGGLAAAEGDRAEARTYHRQALEILRALTAEFPGHPRVRQDLVFTLSCLAGIEELEGNLTEALLLQEEANTLLQSLIAADPSNAALNRRLRQSQERLLRLCNAEPPRERPAC